MTILLNLADAASDEIAAVYGQIDENGDYGQNHQKQLFVRKSG